MRAPLSRPDAASGPRITARDRRALLAGAALIALTIAGGRGVPAFAALRERARADRAEVSDELHRTRAAIRARAASGDSLTVARGRLAVYDTLLLGSDETAITDGIATALSDAADYAGLAVSGVRIEVDSVPRLGQRARYLMRARLHAELSGTGSQLVELLAWLEECPPLLAVRALTVSPMDPDVPHDRNEALRATIQLEGFGVVQRMRAPRSVRTGPSAASDAASEIATQETER